MQFLPVKTSFRRKAATIACFSCLYGRTLVDIEKNEKSIAISLVNLIANLKPGYTMKKLSSVVFLFLFFATVASMGQKDETIFGNNGLKLTGAWGGWTNGLASFDEESVFMNGGFLGLEFNKTVIVGFGGDQTAENVDFGGDKFDLDYGGLIIGYAPRSYRVLHPRFTFLMGGGELKVKDAGKDNIFVVQPSAGVEVNVFRWFRLGLEGGYRFVSDSDFNQLDDRDISSFFVNLGFRFGWSWGK